MVVHSWGEMEQMMMMETVLAVTLVCGSAIKLHNGEISDAITREYPNVLHWVNRSLTPQR